MMTAPSKQIPFHLSQLAALCREHRAEPKFLFVPSRQVGHNLLTALTRAGVDWANFEAMSPREHAERRFEPLLIAGGLKKLHNDVAIAVVAELLRELKRRDEGSYFDPVGVTPSLARSVWETLQALRSAGVAREELVKGPVRTEKTKALGYLLGRFDEVVRERGLYDPAYVLEHAVREGSLHPVEGVAALLDETPMTRRSFQYLRQSFGDRLARIGRTDYDVAIPPAVSASFLVSEPREGGFVGPAAAIRSGRIDDAALERVRVYGARGPEAEVGDAIRYCLEHEIPLDDVEVAYSNGSVYVPALASVAERFGVDISFAEGVPATLTRPGAGLKGFLDWIVGNCPARQLADLLSAGILSFHRVVDEVSVVDMPELTSHFRHAVLDEGLERYIPAVERLSRSRDARVGSGEEEGETRFERRSRLLSSSIRALVEAVPTTTTLGSRETADLCCDFLARFAVIHGERDERAVESLTDRFQQLGAEGHTDLPRRLALQLAADMVDRHNVQASTARAGSLHAVPIERAAYGGRRHQFVVGLDVDNFPGRAAEDPILLDVERTELSVNLDLKSSQATDRIWHLVRALGMAPGSVYFGTSVFNAEREEAVVYPSPFFQSVAKQLAKDYLNPPPLSVDPFHIEDTAILLPQRRRHDYRSFLSSCFPWMMEGSRAAEARKSLLFSEFDGLLGASGESIRRLSETVFSPNRMEKLAACPYRYFLHYVLNVRKPDYYEPNPTRWLDPRDFGTLLHELYYDFLKELAERGERPDPRRHDRMLLDRLEGLVELYQELFPPDNQAAFEYERKRLEESALAFLRTEANDPDARPILFEFVFGSEEAAASSAARPVKIRLQDDLEFFLRGRIDRVDALGDDSLAIWDYKTGSSYNFDEGSLLSGGLNLQWVLYAYALEELAPELGLSPRVARSGYYFASDRENGRRIAEAPPERAELYRVLAPLFELAGRGAFLHVTKREGECRFCDFRTVCATESKTGKDLRDMWLPNAGWEGLDPLMHWMEEE